MLYEILQAVGQQLDIYHGRQHTSTSLRVVMDNNVPVYWLQVPELNDRIAEFRDGWSLINFLTDLNSGIDPTKSSIARTELESLKAEKIIRDARVDALEKNIVDLPASQVIDNALLEADRIRAEAEKKLADMEAAKEIAAAKAAEVELAAAVELSKLSVDELTEYEKLSAREV
jgi:hypothetical protein